MMRRGGNNGKERRHYKTLKFVSKIGRQNKGRYCESKCRQGRACK